MTSSEDTRRIAAALERCATALELLATLEYQRAAEHYEVGPDAYLDGLPDWHAELLKRGWLKDPDAAG